MKNLFKMLCVIAILAFAQSAIAQPCIPAAQVQGQPQRCYDGRLIGPAPQPRVVYVQQYVAQPVQMIYVPSPAQNIYRHGTTVYACRPANAAIGTLIGAAIGHVIGRNITLDGHRLGTGGALIGAYAGHEIACDPVTGQRHVAQQTGVVGALVPAEQQVGGVVVASQPRTIREPSDCDIPGHPELQNLQATQSQCDAIRRGLRVTKPGHCRIGGVNYPELVDNEPGCLAKRQEVAQQQTANPAAQASGSPVNAADVRVDASKGTAVSNVCAWVHPGTKQRFDKPAGFDGSCLDFVKKTAGDHGFSVAVRQ